MRGHNAPLRLVRELGELRAARGLSQRQIPGLHPDQISKWELGRGDPSLTNLVAYAQALGMKIAFRRRPGGTGGQ